MFIAAEWTEGSRQGADRSPSSGGGIGTGPSAGLDDGERARPGAARGAPAERRRGGHEREAILRRAGDIADTRAEELGATIAAESGKPIGEAAGEAGRA